MKYEKTDIKRGLALLLAAVMFGGALFVYNPLQTNATEETTVQGDHNGDGNLDVTDLVGWVDDGESGSNDAESLRTELLRIVETSVENDDGTFEGNDGNISIYNSRLLEGSYAYGGAAFMDFEEISTEEGSKLHIKTATTSSADKFKMMYVKFNKAVKKDQKYKVTFDMAPQTDAYKNGSWKVTFCSSGSPATLDSLGARTTVSDPTTFFGENISLSFTAKEDSDCIYMVIWEYGGTNESFEFLMDDIKVTREYDVEQSIINDDGTFEGNAGNISLYNTKYLEGSYNYNQSVAEITFQKVDVDGNTKLSVKTAATSNVNIFKMMYVKVDKAVKKDQLYEVTMDMVPQTDTYKSGNWKVTFCSSGSPATLDSLGERTTVSAPETFFGEDMSLEFTAKSDSDCIYMVIWEYGGSKESFEFLMDNIKVTTKYDVEQSIISDDGTFEGNVGNISLYNTKYLEGSYNYNKTVAEITFQKVDVDNNTKLSVKTAATSNANIFKMMYVKVDKAVKKGQMYEVTMDMIPQTDTYKSGNWKVTFCSSGSSATLDSLGERTTVSAPETFFGEDMSLEFTAKEDSDCIYMVIWEYGGSNESFEFMMDNIQCTETTAE